ncbi:MAG: ArnT family glycosyltransferase [Nitrososphaerales archaeon]
MPHASTSPAALDASSQRTGAAEKAAAAGIARSTRLAAGLRALPLIVALAVFLVAGAYQLQLPGLHYDEAKEAGLNAMQLLTGQPVTAFRNATFSLGPWRVPLMVQDYIGNLNVLLAVPFLALGGINPVALRTLPLVIAALTLVFTWKIADRLGGPLVAAAGVLLLAVNPTFVFWSRQGIFVTNITALFFMAGLWFGIIWWQQRRPVHLILAALCCGFGVYAKLLFVWAAIALFLVGAFALLMERRKRGRWRLPAPSTLALAGLAFVAPLAPLILYNLRTGGTLTSVFGHLGRSYYGVDNSAYGSNLQTRLGQVWSLLRGDHFWYLGGANANEYAPWLLLALVLLAVVAWFSRTRGAAKDTVAGRPAFLPALPLALLILVVMQSAFTVSDLFITHFALLTPLIPLIAALSLGEIVQWAKGRHRVFASLAVGVATLLVVGWAATDAFTVVLYHRGLTLSGGFTAHSDAIYKLAEYLDEQGYASPVALDWGIDAPVAFLTQGRVQPIEVFGYDQLSSPDPGFMERMKPYLANWLTIYIAHAPSNTVFQGRVAAIEAATVHDRQWLEQIRFGQRSSEPVFIVYRWLTQN